MESLEKSQKEQEFIKVYDELADSLFRHCFFRVSDRERAKDLVQETFVKTWEYIVSGKEVSNLKTFLYKVASNLIIDYYRRSKEVSLDVLREEGFDRASKDEQDVFTGFEYAQVLRVLDTLEKKHKEIIIWRYIDGLSPGEIAEISGVSENLISVRLNRALKKLKEKINR